MRKLFISADIEGTAGIAHWDETEKSKADYTYFAKQMTREVKAACEGAVRAGIEEILVKDAHDSGRNIDPSALPECASVYRGWARHPFCMMYGLDDSFEGVVFTGYHSAANMNSNPLSHTMDTRNNFVKINGEICSELMINSLTAAYTGVPVYCVSGDRGLCEWIRSVNPNILTVPVSEGYGSGTKGLHPDVAVRRIAETVEKALKQSKRQDCMFPLPKSFNVEINFKDHFLAQSGSFYPGAKQTGPRTVEFYAEDYWDVLCFFHFVL
ncbi:MAG: D-aminopeptidase [Firmicutes bacterium ADurb.Bin182]|nr:MAG: D-aminopeptidase [Firmicutes bacterium ADurb.Bin182]